MHLHLSCNLRAGSPCTLEDISEEQAPVTVHEIANSSDWPGGRKLQSPIEMTDPLLSFNLSHPSLSLKINNSNIIRKTERTPPQTCWHTVYLLQALKAKGVFKTPWINRILTSTITLQLHQKKQLVFFFNCRLDEVYDLTLIWTWNLPREPGGNQPLHRWHFHWFSSYTIMGMDS